MRAIPTLVEAAKMTSLRVGSASVPVVGNTGIVPPSVPGAGTVANAPAKTVDAASFTAAKPLPDGQSDKAYDGTVLAGDGHNYPAGSIDGVPAFKPNNGKTATDTIVFVNGIGSSRKNDQGQCQTVANATGCNVIGIDNATEGSLKDLIQSAGDIIHSGGDKSVNSLSQLIYSKMMAGQPLHIMGYSQGAIITSRAITDAQNRMMLEGHLTQAQVQQKMHSLLSVETVGGAAPSYPNGPKYVHYLNSWDGVERLVGLENPAHHDAGQGAKTVNFSTGFNFNPFAGHDLNKYMAHYKPFDQVYGG